MFALRKRFYGSGALILTLLTLLLTGSALGAPKAGDPIRVSFDGDTVRAADVSSGGDVIVFACTIGRYSGMRKLGRHVEVVRDADGDGVVSLTIQNLSEVASVWAIVDFDTGRYALAAPGGFAPRAMDIPEHGWRGGSEHFELRRNYLEMLVVRPGVGAWTQSLSEGGSNDDDRQLNTVLRMRLANMQRLHGHDGPPRPPVIVPRDLLLIIDPHELDYFASEAL